MPEQPEKLPSITLAVTIFGSERDDEYLAGIDLTEPLTQQSLAEKAAWLAEHIGRILQAEGIIAPPVEQDGQGSEDGA